MNASTVTTIICVGLGVSFYLIGYLFRIMHWPGAFLSIYLGQALVLVGVVVFVIGKIRQS